MIEAPEQQYAPYQPPPVMLPVEARPNWFLRHKIVSALLIVSVGIYIGGRGNEPTAEPVGKTVATLDKVANNKLPVTPITPDPEPAPVPAPARSAMSLWATANMPVVDAIMGDLDDMGDAADRESLGGIVSACGSFKRHITQLQASPAPDAAINSELSQALRLYKQGADACIALDPDRAMTYIVKAGDHMSRATDLMEGINT
jgi:hypothetical protein